MPPVTIMPLTSSSATVAALGETLVEAVADGASVHFMHPLQQPVAEGFWEKSLAAAARDERIVFGAFDGDDLVATVTLVLDVPPNQPHRAEIGKLMTRVSHRGRGIAKALMQAAEDMAIERGRTLLVLDTAAEDGASKLYEGCGFTLAGIIPDYALKPHGGLNDCMIYWKWLTPVSSQAAT